MAKGRQWRDKEGARRCRVHGRRVTTAGNRRRERGGGVEKRRGKRRGGGESLATTDAGRFQCTKVSDDNGPGCHREREVVGSDLAGQKGHFASPRHTRRSTCRAM